MSRNVKYLVAILAAFFVIGLSGCKSDEEKLISYMEEMGSIMDKNKDDCGKMGEELEKFTKANGEEIKALSKKLNDKSEADQKKAEEKYKERLEKAMGQIMGGVMKCMDNEKVGKALEVMN